MLRTWIIVWCAALLLAESGVSGQQEGGLKGLATPPARPPAGDTAPNVPAPMAGPNAPERSPSGAWVSWRHDLAFEYIDAAMAGRRGSTESEPVDEVFSWLKGEGYKCIAANTVSWRGVNGIARGRQFGQKRYVIECRGACEGVRYQSVRDGADRKFHHGLSKPLPVIQQKTDIFTYWDFEWRFSRTQSAAPAPVVRVYTWGTGMDHGGQDSVACQDLASQ